MNTTIRSCTPEAVYALFYSDEGRDGSRNACAKSLMGCPCCWQLSTERNDGLHYHLEHDSPYDYPHPELCSSSKNFIWDELETLGFVSRFILKAIRNSFHNECVEIVFNESLEVIT